MAQPKGDDGVSFGSEPVLALGAMWSQEFGNAMEAMSGERPTLEARLLEFGPTPAPRKMVS